MSELKDCPFCGGEAIVREDRKGFQIIGCKTLSMLCPNPSIVVYRKNAKEYNYSPWNIRSSTPNSKIRELIQTYYDKIVISSGKDDYNCIIANVCLDLEKLIKGE